MEIRDIIQEIIQKECEAYRLIELGFLVSVQEGVERLLPLAVSLAEPSFDSPVHFQSWREELLSLFYGQLDYAGFVRQKVEEKPFRRFLFFYRKKIAGRFRETYQGETIDSDLAVPLHTLAFKLSSMLDDELFGSEWFQLQSVGKPSEVDELCRNSCRNCFPIELDGLLNRLRMKDEEFWDTLYLTVKKITDIVASRQYIPLQYKKEIVQDTWSDVSLFLHERVTGNRTPEFQTSRHFRYYIARVCLNKLRESIRKNCCQEVSLEILADLPEMEPLSDASEEKVDEALLTGVLEDIDVGNKEEVGRAFAIILWDKMEPWYSLIIKGLKDKVELLFLHYVQGLSYETIASIQGEGLTEKEVKRLEAKLRQDVVRTRRLLKERFMELLEKNKTK